MKQKDVGLRVSEHDEIDHEKLASTNPNPKTFQPQPQPQNYPNPNPNPDLR